MRFSRGWKIVFTNLFRWTFIWVSINGRIQQNRYFWRNLYLGNVSKDLSASNTKNSIDVDHYKIHIQIFDGKKWHSVKMFKFIKEIFVSAMMFFGCNLSSVNSLKCVSIRNQECKVRPEIVNVNSIKPAFFPFSIKTSKCSGISNNINDPYANMCVPDVIKI